MYTPTALIVLAAASATAFTFAERGAAVLARREVEQGWSVQSDSAPDETTSCGKGSYCPSSLFCFDAKTAEVASCCAENTPCVGEVEGSPVCADSSWNMFIGNDGNGFCCEVGKVGVFDSSAKTVACVDSDAVGSSSTAILTQSGSGAAATSRTDTSAASTSTSSSSSSSSSEDSSSEDSSSEDSSSEDSSSEDSSSEDSSSEDSSSEDSSVLASSTMSAGVMSNNAATQILAGTNSTNMAGVASPTGSMGDASLNPGNPTGGAEKRDLTLGLVAAGLMVVAAL